MSTPDVEAEETYPTVIGAYYDGGKNWDDVNRNFVHFKQYQKDVTTAKQEGKREALEEMLKYNHVYLSTGEVPKEVKVYLKAEREDLVASLAQLEEGNYQ